MLLKLAVLQWDVFASHSQWSIGLHYSPEVIPPWTDTGRSEAGVGEQGSPRTKKAIPQSSLFLASDLSSKAVLLITFGLPKGYMQLVVNY